MNVIRHKVVDKNQRRFVELLRLVVNLLQMALQENQTENDARIRNEANDLMLAKVKQILADAGIDDRNSGVAAVTGLDFETGTPVAKITLKDKGVDTVRIYEIYTEA